MKNKKKRNQIISSGKIEVSENEGIQTSIFFLFFLYNNRSKHRANANKYLENELPNSDGEV